MKPRERKTSRVSDLRTSCPFRSELLWLGLLIRDPVGALGLDAGVSPSLDTNSRPIEAEACESFGEAGPRERHSRLGPAGGHCYLQRPSQLEELHWVDGLPKCAIASKRGGGAGSFLMF